MLTYKHDATGRSTSKIARSRERKKLYSWNGEPFVQIGLELLISPAWTCLSHAARKVLDRLCIEHMRHGGKENGQLPCTFSDFEKHGVRRKSIASAINALEAVGLVKRTRTGHLLPDGRSGAPSLYQITFFPIYKGHELIAASHDWKAIKSNEEASAAIEDYQNRWTARKEAKLSRRKSRRELRTVPATQLSSSTEIQNSSSNCATT